MNRLLSPRCVNIAGPSPASSDTCPAGHTGSVAPGGRHGQDVNNTVVAMGTELVPSGGGREKPITLN